MTMLWAMYSLGEALINVSSRTSHGKGEHMPGLDARSAGQESWAQKARADEKLAGRLKKCLGKIHQMSNSLLQLCVHFWYML